ncbi:MAG: hypothetical protein IIY02_05975 [Firmicutes bacterium]|nr:hypothetical protein [Bacillota bacterium]
MKKLTLALIALMLIFAFAACGGGEDPNAGTYYLTSAEVFGVTLTADDLSEAMGTDVSNYYIELESNGDFNGDSGAGVGYGTWTLDGTALTLTEDGVDMTGTLENGVMSIYEPTSGVTLIFER